jgi:hypothetical protein
VEWVAKCQGPRVGGGPLRAPASELKTLKISFEKHNYLQIYSFRFLFNGNIYIYIYIYIERERERERERETYAHQTLFATDPLSFLVSPLQ